MNEICRKKISRLKQKGEETDLRLNSFWHYFCKWNEWQAKMKEEKRCFSFLMSSYMFHRGFLWCSSDVKPPQTPAAALTERQKINTLLEMIVCVLKLFQSSVSSVRCSTNVTVKTAVLKAAQVIWGAGELVIKDCNMITDTHWTSEVYLPAGVPSSWYPLWSPSTWQSSKSSIRYQGLYFKLEFLQ